MAGIGVKTSQRIQLLIREYKLQPIVLLALLVTFSWVYSTLATLHATVQNQDVGATDQGAYLSFAQKVHASGFRYTGDRNRMPLYPFIQALFLDPNASEQDQFSHGKQVNIVLSLVLLIILIWLTSRFLTPGLTISFMLVAAFALYVFKAGYFQAELLFYSLTVASFIMMGWLLVSPSLKLGIATGIVASLAQLTKASILPMVAVFLVFYALKIAPMIWRMAKEEPAKPSHNLRQLGYHIGIALCVLLGFLGVLYPYIHESKQLFGQYFYNVNSTFYIWYDSWEEVKQGTRAYGDREGWPDMPPEDVPSFQRYIREHTPTQIKGRLVDGLRKQYDNLSGSYTHFNYLAVFSIALLVSGIIGARRTFPLLKKNIVLVGFVAATFATYLLLYSWYAAIAAGSRFTLSLFLPILFSCTFALKHVCTQYGTINFKGYSLKGSTLLCAFNFAILILIVIDLIQYVPLRLANGYFGL